MTKLNGGIALEREIFSDRALNVFDIAINHRRQLLVLPGDAERGTRFRDNKDVLARLESMFTEIEFLGCPGPTIDKALIDAAQSDYWYSHEKKYDDESYFHDEMEIEDIHEDDGEDDGRG